MQQRRETVVVNPELIGVMLQRLARLRRTPIPDFQDIALWRRLTVGAIRIAALRNRPIVVPMAFDNVNYLTEVRDGLASAGLTAHHVCLVAPQDIVPERLRQRGANDVRDEWQYRRASECCIVHTSSTFATHVDAAEQSPLQVAGAVLRAWDSARGVDMART